ncbi:MAG: 1-(5-phosphoribosyl)-5-[(5-phosphoribosylamino)methylideneamino]imidazole-4-carboxamide isomerase [Deltaproteobacteria bacterium]|nr:1-(5-phosphoribosyl)-5-[(5-phosphoribosylamino)methylideneamino]imidazole-4-carboxamide isomerase [Deltaproteobacteria bacterium]MCL5791483.1 1-(5-phosphoribosyl)-5-[(5-phosphoribosylamino)methylideneamino]imidazole-4-carboxamide isomerase [Deltaproteobacteria bacterium]
MQIIPAIDIKSGKCVRLFRGSFNRVDIYSDDPVRMAEQWEAQGAGMLHVVDLDAAVTGKPVNRDYILDIVKHVKIPVQVGGGMRDRKIIEYYIDKGVRSVVITTYAYEQADEVIEIANQYKDTISIGVDIISGAVAIKGWTQTGSITAKEFVKRFSSIPIHRFIFTDIYKDGTLSGMDVNRIRNMLEGISEPVVISGGISSVDDIVKLKRMDIKNIKGIIIGRAIYTGAVKLNEAIEAAV